MPASTLRTWVLGRKDAPAVIRIDDPKKRYLSFVNLVEAHVLASMRRQHEVKLPKVRRALQYVSRQFGIVRPLADLAFQTDGLDLFIEHYDDLINVSQEGQRAMKDVVSAYLQRIERDAKGLPIRLFPFTRKRDSAEAPVNEPRLIVFAPDVSFGRPVVAGRGIPVEEIVSRFDAGDSVTDIAKDFRVNPLAVEEALRYRPVAA
jgi:uncharacterized protein (DUF433 family)